MSHYEQNEILNITYDRPAATLRADSIGSLQEAYEIIGSTIYYGKAAMGFGTGDEAWIIKKYILNDSDGTGKTALGKWTDRASLTYT